tara:strand:+ start:35 stop:325 length:291 start_codon:yes stop_codon:yes gene_type:complete
MATNTSGFIICIYTFGTIGIASTIFYMKDKFYQQNKNSDKIIQTEPEILDNIKTKITRSVSIQCNLGISDMEYNDEIQIIETPSRQYRWFFMNKNV